MVTEGNLGAKLQHRMDNRIKARVNLLWNIPNTFPNTEKRVENTTRNDVFLTNYEVLGNVIKHGLEYQGSK